MNLTCLKIPEDTFSHDVAQSDLGLHCLLSIACLNTLDCNSSYVFQIESVDLALKILDGSDVRGHKIKVEKASFNMKGDFDPSKKRKKLTNKEKRKFKEKQAK